MRLQDKVALVTGSTRGIGRATAELFAREGARVCVTGRDAAAGDEVVEAIARAGGTAFFKAADICDEAAVQALVEAVERRYGRLDVLMNNASPTEITRGATRRDGPVDEISLADWKAVFDTATDGFFLATKHAIPAMRRSGGGSIINISSAVSVRGFHGAAAYPAAKGAINSLTESLAATYGAERIRANAIIVGLIATSEAARATQAHPQFGPALLERHLVPRWGEPADVAYAALYLASDESQFVTGSLLYVDGGISCNAAFPVPKASPLAGR